MDGAEHHRGPVRVRVEPAPLRGQVRVPGDKSLSHRALLLGALADDPVSVAGVAPSGDVASTARALRRMGARVELSADEHGQLGGEVAGPLVEPEDVLDCGNSGTSLRLLAGVAAGIEGVTVLTGDRSLRRRPVARVAEPLRQMGAAVSARAGDRLPPLVIRGGSLRGISFTSPVASAQVKSCLLLAGLRADGRTTITSPRRSRDHTERMLRHLGHTVDVAGDADGQGAETVTIEPGRLAAAAIEVGGDPSSAAFWLVAAAIAGSAVRVDRVNVNPGRAGALAVLADLGADVRRHDEQELGGEPTATVEVAEGGFATSAGRIVTVAGTGTVDALDELPVLALAGALSPGGLEVRDAGELRVKESDRIAALERLFAALGMTLRADADGFVVPGGQRPSGGTVDAGGDHRIAMTACVAATIATAPVEITGFDAVATSYPDFLDDLGRLGGSAEVLEATHD